MAKTPLKTYQQKQQENNSVCDICYLENICGAEQNLTYTIEDKLNIDVGKLSLVLAMFLNQELF